jgi:hypothetical protein
MAQLKPITVLKGLSMKPIKSYLTIVALATLFLASSVIAEAQAQKKIYDRLTLQQIMTIMKDEGYNVELYADKEAIAWILSGKEVCLITTDQPNSLNFYTYQDGGTVDLAAANTWNENYEYSKVYLDDDKDVALELDLDLTGGVTEGRIKDFFKTCQRSHTQWLKEVMKKP